MCRAGIFVVARCAVSSAAFQNFRSIPRLRILKPSTIDVEHTGVKSYRVTV
jgi:hypothetical protein